MRIESPGRGGSSQFFGYGSPAPSWQQYGFKIDSQLEADNNSCFAAHGLNEFDRYIHETMDAWQKGVVV
jgi:hypothetical protein